MYVEFHISIYTLIVSGMRVYILQLEQKSWLLRMIYEEDQTCCLVFPFGRMCLRLIN